MKFENNCKLNKNQLIKGKYYKLTYMNMKYIFIFDEIIDDKIGTNGAYDLIYKYFNKSGFFSNKNNISLYQSTEKERSLFDKDHDIAYNNY